MSYNFKGGDEFLALYNSQKTAKQKEVRRYSFAKLQLKRVEPKTFTRQKENMLIHRLSMKGQYGSQGVATEAESVKLNVFLPSISSEGTLLPQSKKTNSTFSLPMLKGSRQENNVRRRKNLTTKELTDLFSKLRLQPSTKIANKQKRNKQDDWVT